MSWAWAFSILSAVGLSSPVAPPATTANRISVAVLDFELRDLTPLPDTPEELERTASLAPLMQRALAAKSGYDVVAVASDAQARANAGPGYLYDRPELAAELGTQYGADWVVVGRLNKVSFLVSDLQAQVVNVRTRQVVAVPIVELKGFGGNKELIEKGAESLAAQIDRAIARYLDKLGRAEQ